MKRKKNIIFLIFLISLLFSSCVFPFINTLPTLKKLKEILKGTWKSYSIELDPADIDYSYIYTIGNENFSKVQIITYTNNNSTTITNTKSGTYILRRDYFLVTYYITNTIGTNVYYNYDTFIISFSDAGNNVYYFYEDGFEIHLRKE